MAGDYQDRPAPPELRLDDEGFEGVPGPVLVQAVQVETRSDWLAADHDAPRAVGLDGMLGGGNLARGRRGPVKFGEGRRLGMHERAWRRLGFRRQDAPLVRLDGVRHRPPEPDLVGLERPSHRGSNR